MRNRKKIMSDNMVCIKHLLIPPIYEKFEDYYYSHVNCEIFQYIYRMKIVFLIHDIFILAHYLQKIAK